MAVDGKPEPPRTLGQWLEFIRWARARPDWFPGKHALSIRWPKEWEGTRGPSWIPLAQDHPFKGQSWCWRCLAEAQGVEGIAVPHDSEGGAICWGGGQAAPSAEDPDPDTGQARLSITADGRQVVSASEAWITKLDPEGQPIPGTRERLFPPAEGVDTGTIFYTPPLQSGSIGGWVGATVDLPEEIRLWTAQPEPPEADQPERFALAYPQSSEADHRDTWPPSWTDDEESTPAGDSRAEPDGEPQP
jgi:hypothetical protein